MFGPGVSSMSAEASMKPSKSGMGHLSVDRLGTLVRRDRGCAATFRITRGPPKHHDGHLVGQQPTDAWHGVSKSIAPGCGVEFAMDQLQREAIVL